MATIIIAGHDTKKRRLKTEIAQADMKCITARHIHDMAHFKCSTYLGQRESPEKAQARTDYEKSRIAYMEASYRLKVLKTKLGYLRTGIICLEKEADNETV